MDRRNWVEAIDRVIFFMERSTWAADGLKDEHPWDMDCVWEQLAAQEAGLA